MKAPTALVEKAADVVPQGGVLCPGQHEVPGKVSFHLRSQPVGSCAAKRFKARLAAAA